MDQNQRSAHAPNRKAIVERIFIQCFIILALAILFIVFRRGYMNYTNRMDFIAQRLDDYPRMLANYTRETDEMQELWLTSNYQSLAEQAVVLYRWSDAPEAEKLESIARTLGVARACVISSDDQEAAAQEIEGRDLDAAFAPLPDGRSIALEIEKSEEFRELRTVEQSAFLSQLETGMPGYMLVLEDGGLSIYPQDENSGAVQEMVQAMLDSGLLDVDALRAAARTSPDEISFLDARSIGTETFPEGHYVLRCAGYANIDNIVFSVAERAELSRYGRKRTWSMVVLTLAVFAFLSLALWRTRLYYAGIPRSQGHRTALRRCRLALALASVVLLVTVLDIQMLSAVNQCQDSTSASADFLRNVLEQETLRAEIICVEFDDIYQKRAETAAKILSRDPGLIDLDALVELDAAMRGIGLRVYDKEGKLVASDELYHQELPNQDAQAEQHERVYRAPLLDESGRTTGFVTLHADQAMLDPMLADTRTEEVVRDLHVVDTLMVVAVDKADRETITASSLPTWIGDGVSERGIPANVLHDGYEGVLLVDGHQMYTSIFAYGSNLILVASRGVSAIVFLKGVALLALGLLLLLCILYALMIPSLYDLQAVLANDGALEEEKRSNTPSLREFMQNFMLTLFTLWIILYLITNGNTSSLTYNMVRGVWVRGVNVVTVTTCLMAISAVVTLHVVLSIVLKQISRYLQPKGRTICQLIDSGSHYLGAIFLIMYAMSMFGVDTATLIGGAGVVALIFTLGANSLIANVVAGIFIIFEGHIMVGDVVEIDDFHGVVADITMRTTVLVNGGTQDIKIISNSQISELVNKSRKPSRVVLELEISHNIGLIRGEQIIREALAMLPGRHPEIIGMPEYLGVVDLPQLNVYTEKIQGIHVQVRFECLEKDRSKLTNTLRRELVWVCHVLLNDDSQVGIEGCKVVDPLEDRGKPV